MGLLPLQHRSKAAEARPARVSCLSTTQEGRLSHRLVLGPQQRLIRWRMEILLQQMGEAQTQTLLLRKNSSHSSIPTNNQVPSPLLQLLIALLCWATLLLLLRPLPPPPCMTGATSTAPPMARATMPPFRRRAVPSGATRTVRRCGTSRRRRPPRLRTQPPPPRPAARTQPREEVCRFPTHRTAAAQHPLQLALLALLLPRLPPVADDLDFWPRRC